ncbi:TIGR03885 family FMN-dependent LLM class oxidoreductase [Pedobacter sp. SYSU D00535]|uniref:TIGR03885 family FMN-dependent LLM class oxidoreductase n=1 Tax=Pedobacter sp. SYSU D00535 TaxID=2810308 RepID=UPI001A97CFB7|nr:TIGR03885 family FMN-dependent LLM class oxidoreductase [Pedobacter sp. SYSU D00535]
MAEIGYQASHEQFAPSELLKLVDLAEKAGFQAINSSDHFHPWSERQGHSGFSFAWLGAAMRNSSVPYGVVCAPGQRYHPAIVAQAAATLAEMFPNRFWVALGSGEALNEKITGQVWPPKEIRNQRLLECVTVMRRLLAGETVSHRGLVEVENARLYSLPPVSPLLIGAAVTKETAAWAGSWADGLITISKPIEELREVVKAFRDNGGEGKPMYLKVQLSYAHTEEEALMGAFDQWKTNIFQGTVLADLPTVAHFDAAGEFVKPEDLFGKVNISASPEKHTQWIKEYESLGFQKIILHNVNREQELFIKDFGEKVLPALR